MPARKLTETEIIKKTVAFARKHHGADPGGHDWYHIERVWKMARKIARIEGADLFVVQLAALLHDVADWKDNGDLQANARASRRWLRKLGVDNNTIKHVEHIVSHVSFKGAGVPDKMPSLEGRVVQDADRLDAIGAIAIARVFAWGATRRRPIYIPTEKLTLHKSFRSYARSKPSGIMAFYERVLLHKNRLHTVTAKNIAGPRHEFMKAFLKQFFKEWKGK
ncbi:MAG: HD domain-containing protein [Patescibacteria group bacterium]